MDVSSIDGHSIAPASARALVIKVDGELHNAGPLTPRQLISGGVGNARDPEISRLSIPGADSFYGAGVMLEHCNHIHGGPHGRVGTVLRHPVSRGLTMGR